MGTFRKVVRRFAAAGISLVSCAALSATTTASARAETAADADASGEQMPVGDLPGWRQIFSDNFSTAVPLGKFPQAVSGKWWSYPAGWFDTSHNGAYLPAKVVSVHDGLMDMYLHTENGQPLVSAPVPKLNGPGAEGGLLYGRYAVRFKADRIPYYKTAWLLWPDSENWLDGEIDFPEGNLDQRISGFVHYVNQPTSQSAFNTSANYSVWHTAVTEWTPDAVWFYLDGKAIGKLTDKSKIPAKPMHWVLQTETTINGGKPPATVAGHVYVDWVTAYSYQPQTAAR